MYRALNHDSGKVEVPSHLPGNLADVAIKHIAHSSRVMKNHLIHLYNIVFFFHMTTLNSKQHIHELTILSLSFVYVFVCLKLLEYLNICTAVLLYTRCLISILEFFFQTRLF